MNKAKNKINMVDKCFGVIACITILLAGAVSVLSFFVAFSPAVIVLILFAFLASIFVLIYATIIQGREIERLEDQILFSESF